MNLVRSLTQKKKNPPASVDTLPRSAAAQAIIDSQGRTLRVQKQNIKNREIFANTVKELEKAYRSQRRASELEIDKWIEDELANYRANYNKEYIDKVLRGRDNVKSSRSSQKTIVNKRSGSGSGSGSRKKSRSSQKTLVNKRSGSGSKSSGSKKRIAYKRSSSSSKVLDYYFNNSKV